MLNFTWRDREQLCLELSELTGRQSPSFCHFLELQDLDKHHQQGHFDSLKKKEKNMFTMCEPNVTSHISLWRQLFDIYYYYIFGQEGEAGKDILLTENPAICHGSDLSASS